MNLNADSVAAITGAANGIGWALARALAERGATLMLIDIDADALEDRLIELRALGCDATVHCVDIADREAVFALAETLQTERPPLNLLINNAGVSASAPFPEIDLQDFEWTMGVNFWGTVYTTKALLPSLITSSNAAIVSILSGFALMALPTKAPYCSSKFAGRGFAASLRADLAETNVTVHEVYPPAVKTGIVARGRTWDEAKRQAEAEFIQQRGHTPDTVARTILRGLERDRTRILIGLDTRLMDYASRFFPVLTPRMVAGQRHRIPFL